MSSNISRRRIIVCLDGTWETPQERTNVSKFFSNIDTSYKSEEWDYRTEYYPGLGTTGSFPLLGGAFGFGITNQIQSAYKFICRNYQDENDEIWLVGFSRGAYAVRSLSGMIYNVGLLPESNLKHVGRAYDLYRDRCDDTHPDKIQSTEFRKKYECKMPQIHFLGCFDTVGSLGVPKLPWYLGGSIFYSLFFGLHGFHDTKLSPIVKSAYHALSIHDQRKWFCPTLMHFSTAAPQNQTLEQVWFPGMHGDVGGQETGIHDNILSCHSLRWMMEKAEKNGIKFKDQANCGSNTFIYDDSYDSSIIYKLMPRWDRIIEKDEVKKEYDVSQLYKQGRFDEYITQDDLALYKSKTLDHFYANIQKQLKDNHD